MRRDFSRADPIGCPRNLPYALAAMRYLSGKYSRTASASMALFSGTSKASQIYGVIPEESRYIFFSDPHAICPNRQIRVDGEKYLLESLGLIHANLMNKILLSV